MYNIVILNLSRFLPTTHNFSNCATSSLFLSSYRLALAALSYEKKKERETNIENRGKVGHNFGTAMTIWVWKK
jgi:hypothetical protein